MIVPATTRLAVPTDLAAHPALAALLARTPVEQAAPGEAAPLAIAGNGLVVGPALDGRPGALILLRFGLELAWMRRLPGLPEGAATLLAARAAGCFAALLPSDNQRFAAEDPAVSVFTRLAGEPPPLAQLTSCWRLLVETGADAESPPDLAALRLVERLWPFAAPTEALLIQGGDDRLTLAAETSHNRYLCPPWPQPDIISFSSCTASSISLPALAAAEQARQQLFAAALQAPADTVLADASDEITQSLLAHFDAAHIAEAILSASGTDATLLLTGLLAAERPRQTITTVLMSPFETGSGVPEAVQGRHFAPCTAAGITVEKGGAVDGFPPGLALVSIELRSPDGLPRPAEEIAAECETAIGNAASRGHVVLHAIDGSKTGLAAPDLLALDLLADRFGGRLDIIIDACQLRIEPERVRLYLERGWPVLITGSKFFGAPGFCGAILFPRARLRRIAGAGKLPGGLGAYADLSDGSVSRRCPGLLLRWTAALMQMRAFAHMPAAEVRRAIETVSAHTRAAMMRYTDVKLVAAPRPKSGPWSHYPSVLTFAIKSGHGFLSAASLRPFYLALAGNGADELPSRTTGAERSLAATRCLIGQPVQLGGPGIGGLRIAFSAAQLANGHDMQHEISTVFAKLALLLSLSPERN